MQQDQSTNEEQKSDIQPIIEERNWETPDFTFIPKGNHLYRQEGPYLICKSCELGHATYIGMKVVMVGMDEQGQPIFKSRKELGI